MTRILPFPTLSFLLLRWSPRWHILSYEHAGDIDVRNIEISHIKYNFLISSEEHDFIEKAFRLEVPQGGCITVIVPSTKNHSPDLRETSKDSKGF